MKSYRIKETFYTLQGEGYHAGRPAYFIRFAGCNMWSGHNKDRQRDAARNEAECPKWCDTDFVNGERLELGKVAARLTEDLRGALPADEVGLIVLTGGEPLLQLDAQFVEVLRETFPVAELAVETNGTVLPKVPVGTRCGLDWVCVSPKQKVDKLVLTSGNELKVVYPAYNPMDYESIADNFQHTYVSAEATTIGLGKSLISNSNLRKAAEFVMQNRDWKLTTQSHKVWGLP